MEMDQQPQPDSNPLQPREKSLGERIWQYKLHYVIVLPAMLLILLFKVIPLWQGVHMSFLDYKPFLGRGESPWIGFGNYAELFGMPDFGKALANTVAYKLMYVAAGGALAFVMAMALSGIRSGRLRGWIASLLVVPYVIPSAVLGQLAMLLVSPGASPLFSWDTMPLAEAGSFRLVLLMTELFKYGGIPIVVALLAIAGKHAEMRGGATDGSLQADFWQLNALPAAKAIAAIMLLQLAFFATTDFELLHTMISALVAQEVMTVDYFIHHHGFLMMNSGPAAAATIIVIALQLAFVLLAYMLLRGALAKALFHRHGGLAADLQGGSRAAGAAAAIAGAGAVLLVLYVMMVDPFIRPSEAGVPLSALLPPFRTGLAIILFGAATVVGMLINVTLAYPMTVRRLPGGTLYRLFLIAMACAGTGTIYEYMFFRNMGAVNTLLPVLFTGFIHIAAIFVLKSIFNARCGHLKEQAEAEGKGELHAFFMLYLPNIWRPLLALGALQFIALWGAYLPSLIYVSDPSQYIGMINYINLMRSELAAGGGYVDPLLFRIGAIVSLPPLAVFLLFRRWIVSEVLIGGLFKR